MKKINIYVETDKGVELLFSDFSGGFSISKFRKSIETWKERPNEYWVATGYRGKIFVRDVIQAWIED